MGRGRVSIVKQLHPTRPRKKPRAAAASHPRVQRSPRLPLHDDDALEALLHRLGQREDALDARPDDHRVVGEGVVLGGLLSICFLFGWDIHIYGLRFRRARPLGLGLGQPSTPSTHMHTTHTSPTRKPRPTTTPPNQ